MAPRVRRSQQRTTRLQMPFESDQQTDMRMVSWA
jgi:hypothetical protein